VRALVVGAGAVGHVLALHLKRAGAHVTFAVRSPEKVHPTTLTRLGWFGRRDVSVFAADEVVSGLTEKAFELIFITLPSDALNSPWVASLAKHFGDAIVVGLQPGLEDRARLLALGICEPRLVRGLTSLVSYATPLSAVDALNTEGYAYWLPPLTPFAFDGPRPSVDAVVSTLKRGGLPATHRPGLEHEAIFFTAALLVTVRALERHGWSLQALRRDPSLSIVASAQALAVTSHRLNRAASFGHTLITRSWFLGLATSVAPKVLPFDFETYVRVHFTKVAPQSRLLLTELIDEGRRFGLPVDALEKLLGWV
jgi:hypothetical protein